MTAARSRYVAEVLTRTGAPFSIHPDADVAAQRAASIGGTVRPFSPPPSAVLPMPAAPERKPRR